MIMLDPTPKPSSRHFYYQDWDKSPDFGAERKLIEDDGDSGIVSPPLWRTSPQHRHSNYRNLSPSSRAQAIARGQRELMEMVSRMPEGCYELSLKDIVEHSVSDPVKEERFSEETSVIRNEDAQMKEREKEREKKRSNSMRAQMSRSGSIDNGGFLLKMVFPISFGAKKKKTTKVKSNSSNNSVNRSDSGINGGGSGRVSPRPLLMDGSPKAGENEWWKKRYAGAEESESAGFSSNSGSSKSSGCSSSRSSSRNSTARHGGRGCWGFIFGKRPTKAEEKHE